MSIGAKKVKTYSEYIRKYVKRLFAAAYLITGNYAAAEAALGEALFRTVSEGKTSNERSFLSAAVENTKDAAFACLSEHDGERTEADTNTGLFTDSGYPCLAELGYADGRLLMLHYALRLKTSEAAFVLGISSGSVREKVRVLTAGFASAAGIGAHEAEEKLAEIAYGEMEDPSVVPPDAGSVLRMLEMDLSTVPPRRHPLRRAIRAVLFGVGGLLLAALLLLLVILTEPF